MPEPAGVAVSQQQVPDVERRRMSYDEWWALPEKPKAEWVDGEVVIVNVPPNLDHSDSTFGLWTALRRAMPEVKVYADVDLRLPRNRVRRPDLMVLPARPSELPVTETPLLVVEILSPGTHAVDTLEKAPEYAQAGIGQFWIVDPEARTLDIYRLVDGGWVALLRLDAHASSGEVAVGEYGVVPLDLDDVLAG